MNVYELKQETRGQRRARAADRAHQKDGENMRQVTWVLIDEIKSGFFGAGGHGYTTEEIQALMAGEPALKA
ncbi:MAG TPA: hypothetical protein VJ808_12405 [Gemmatimonadales bacterium]|nr:hypothetical protein [Gemmatimonadales bacterium]